MKVRRQRVVLLAVIAVAAFGVISGVGCSGGVTTPDKPVLFDIGTNDRTALVAFGDSISWGKDSSDGLGYRHDLEVLLAGAGKSGMRVINEGIPGTYASAGAERIGEVLRRDRPAVLLLLYGTNDESSALPQSVLLLAREAETTSEYLRTIISAARANKTLVVVATLPPVCGHARIAQRERTITMNDKIRALANEMGKSDLGVLSADPWNDFLDLSPPDGCGLIGESGNHPTDLGYSVLATSFFKALESVSW